MINVAVMGYGTVGRGVVNMLADNADLISRSVNDEFVLKRILDIRKFPGDRFEQIITDDFNSILNDRDIDVVFEAMGGENPAFTFTFGLLNNGKSVITSNKELVSKHGPELNEIAVKNGVSYRFEASVGGGIPLISTLKRDLASVNHIDSLDGILNGTTNYILTRMTDSGSDFNVSLSEAQKLGYAEANPSADIEGTDVNRKISILSGVLFGKILPERFIFTTGITSVTPEIISAASAFDGKIKLIGSLKKIDNRIFAAVRPCLVKSSCILSSVNDVFNGVLIKNDYADSVLLYGKGAGAAPTAASMISDFSKYKSSVEDMDRWQFATESDIFDHNEYAADYMAVLPESGMAAEVFDKEFEGTEKIKIGANYTRIFNKKIPYKYIAGFSQRFPDVFFAEMID